MYGLVTLLKWLFNSKNRVAGGWVRDKILNQQSVDIDLALNDQSGVEFASNVNEYLKHIGMETRTIAVIQVSQRMSSALVVLFLLNMLILIFRQTLINPSIWKQPT